LNDLFIQALSARLAPGQGVCIGRRAITAGARACQPDLPAAPIPGDHDPALVKLATTHVI